MAGCEAINLGNGMTETTDRLTSKKRAGDTDKRHVASSVKILVCSIDFRKLSVVWQLP